MHLPKKPAQYNPVNIKKLIRNLLFVETICIFAAKLKIMKKLIVIIVVLLGLFGCSHSVPTTYNFEALRDTLNLPDDCIFVEECSPLYSDNNPYNLPDQQVRVKTLYYYVVHNDHGLDTIIHAVFRNNQTVFWGKSSPKKSARELIEWTINNRDKI